LSLGTAGAASAATVSVDGSGVLTYAAVGGHLNLISLSQASSDVTVTRNTGGGFFGPPDDDALTNGAGCDAPVSGIGTESSTCHGVTSVVVNLSDRDDSASASGLTTIPVTANGGDGDDGLTGGSSDTGDTLNGENGDDTLSGLGGPDTLNGGAGADSLNGGSGNDRADGGAGNDNIGDSGTPTVPAPTTPGPNDTSNDTLTGGDGSDVIDGGAGDDSIDGGDGSDFTLTGDTGTDTVSGGNGDDGVIATQDGVADTYNGGAGNDTISYATYDADVGLSLVGGEVGASGEKDKLAADFENANGGEGNDVLGGTDVSNFITGGGGNDIIAGAGGNDDLFGGNGNDTLSGGEGRDNVNGDDGNDTVNGENGDDDLGGGSGDDLLNGGAGVDTADYGDHGDVTVTLDGVANDGSAGETDNADADKAVENVITGPGDDNVVGNALPNFIDTGSGNDGIDVRDGTFGVDIVSCGSGYDTAAGDVLDTFDRSGPTRCENVPKATFTRVGPAIAAKVTPKSDKTKPFRFTTSGMVTPPPSVPAAQGCGSNAFMIIQVKAGQTTISTRRAAVHDNCKFSSTVSLNVPSRFFGHDRLRFIIRYSGNRYLSPVTLKTKHVSVG